MIREYYGDILYIFTQFSCSNKKIQVASWRYVATKDNCYLQLLSQWRWFQGLFQHRELLLLGWAVDASIFQALACQWACQCINFLGATDSASATNTVNFLMTVRESRGTYVHHHTEMRFNFNPWNKMRFITKKMKMKIETRNTRARVGIAGKLFCLFHQGCYKHPTFHSILLPSVGWGNIQLLKTHEKHKKEIACERHTVCTCTFAYELRKTSTPRKHKLSSHCSRWIPSPSLLRCYVRSSNLN